MACTSVLRACSSTSKLQDKRTLGEILLKLLGIVKLNINGNAEFRNERMFNENVETPCSMFCFVLFRFVSLFFFRDAKFFSKIFAFEGDAIVE